MLKHLVVVAKVLQYEVIMEEKTVLLAIFQDHIYKLLNGFYTGQETPSDDVILIQAAVLLKTAMELYAISFDDDTKINKILDSAKEAIPGLRDRLDSHMITSPTIH